MSRLLCAAALAFAAFAPASLAGDPCAGTPGYKLTLDPTIQIGQTFHMRVEAPGNSFVIVLISAGPGPTSTPYGTLCLSLPEMGAFMFTMPACGDVKFPHDVPCEDRFIGLAGYFQFLAAGPNPGQIGISNQQHIEIKDGNCGCDDDDSSDDDSSDDRSDDDSRSGHDNDSDDCSDDDSRSGHDNDSDDCSDDDSHGHGGHDDDSSDDRSHD